MSMLIVVLLMAELGVSKFEDLIGRSDLLDLQEERVHLLAKLENRPNPAQPTD